MNTDYIYTILIVDDSENNLNLLSQILSFDEFKIVKAQDANEALEFLEQFSPDLILLDLMMPEMNGFELLSVLKNNPLRSAIPVIVVTARTDDHDRYECFRLGAADFITKPVIIEDLLNRISTILQIEIEM